MAQAIVWPSSYKDVICAARIVTILIRWVSVTIVVTVFQPALSKHSHYKMALLAGIAPVVNYATPVFSNVLANQAL